MVGEVVDHVAGYGSKAAEGLLAFNIGLVFWVFLLFERSFKDHETIVVYRLYKSN